MSHYAENVDKLRKDANEQASKDRAMIDKFIQKHDLI
jgi:hypothetical protein